MENFRIIVLIIQITLFVLKVSGVLKISWFWVFAPILVPLGILILLLIIAGIAALLNKYIL